MNSSLTTPVVWNSGQIHLLEMPTGARGYPSDVNEWGHVAGSVRLEPRSSPQPASWDANGLHVLPIDNGEYGFGKALNDSGDVVGWVRLPSDHTIPVEWRNGEMHELPRLFVGDVPDRDNAYARDVNNSGLIVGEATTAEYRSHAVLWSGGQIFDLNDLLPANSGWELYNATGINDEGRIAGYGMFQGQIQPFILTPTSVPEPAAASSLAMFSLIPLSRRGRRAGH